MCTMRPNSFLGQPRSEGGRVVQGAMANPNPEFYPLLGIGATLSMIPGPENFSFVLVRRGTEQWPGQALGWVYLRMHQGGSGPSGPPPGRRGGCNLLLSLQGSLLPGSALLGAPRAHIGFLSQAASALFSPSLPPPPPL